MYSSTSGFSCGVNFHCSICLSVFSKPVSTPCGHNFCFDCITGYWDTSNPLISCPLCKEEFNIRPKLGVNHFIAEMAAKFKKSVQEKSLNITEESGNGNVLCTLCTGARRPALFLEIMASLEATVTREIRMLCDPNFKEVRRHAVELTLDPDTANSYLYISEDGKQVAWGTQRRRVPNKPERFDCVYNVLAREGFASGRFYYEVQVKDKTQWDLGVAKQSINRRGDIRLSPKNGYWTIRLRRGDEFTVNTDPPVNLHVTEVPEKIGVFVDYEDGQVSFYDVDTRAGIFSFTGCNFTEKIFPFFSPCASNGGKDSAPLIITPVRNNK
uniref:Uncharacterized protein n=1 Tax=Neolamprologus brichardi TaxID=32507 RepID=A0A3Q4MPL9_NEOBR